MANGSSQSVLDVERVWRMERSYAIPISLWFTALERGALDTVQGMLYSGEVHIEARLEGFSHDVTGLLFVALLLRDAGPEARLLLKEGANVNATDERGRTPLMYATQLGNVDVVQALLGVEGIDVNARDDAGNTALHLGFYYFFVPSIARALLNAGADPYVLNDGAERATPLDMAFHRSVSNVTDAGEYDEIFTYGVELRAAFVPYLPDTPSWESKLLLASAGSVSQSKTSSALGFLASVGVFLATLLCMAASLPALLLGAVFSSSGLSAPLSSSIEDLFFATATQVMAPIFVLLVAASVFFTTTLMPILADRQEPDQALNGSSGFMAFFLLLGCVLAAGIGFQTTRDATLRRVERPSPSLRFNAINLFTGALFLLQFVQLWGLTYTDDVVFPSSAGGEALARDLSLSSLFAISTSSRTAFVAAFLAAFIALLIWALAGANLALGLVADYSLHLSALFPSLGSGSWVDYYILDVLIPLLTSGGFLPIVISLFRALKCSSSTIPPPSAPGADSRPFALVLDAAPDITCWAGDHTWYASASLVGLLYYVPTALLLGVIFVRAYAATTDSSSPSSSSFLAGGLDIKYAPVLALIELPFRALLAGLRIFVSSNVWVYLSVLGLAFVLLAVAMILLRPFRDSSDTDALTGPISAQSRADPIQPASRGSLSSLSFGGVLNRIIILSYVILVFKVGINLWAASGSSQNPSMAPVIVQHTGIALMVGGFVAAEMLRVWASARRERRHGFDESAAEQSARATRAYIDIYGHSPVVRAGGGEPGAGFARVRSPDLAVEGTDDDYGNIRADLGSGVIGVESSFDEDAALEARLALVRLPSAGGALADEEFMAMQQILQEQLSVAQRERDRSKNKLERAERQVRLLRDTVEGLTGQVADLEAEVSIYRNDGLNSELAVARRAAVQVNEDYDELRDTLDAREDEVTVLRARVAALEDLVDLEAEKPRGHGDDAVYYHDDEVAAALEESQVRVGALEVLVEAAVAERETAEASRAEMEGDLVQIKLRLAQNEFEKQGLLSESRRAKRVIRKLETRVAELEGIVEGGLELVVLSE